MRHSEADVFFTGMVCVAGSRTRVLNETLWASAAGSMHMPVSVSVSGGWPSIATGSRS